jgi:hypothetical protein
MDKSDSQLFAIEMLMNIKAVDVLRCLCVILLADQFVDKFVKYFACRSRESVFGIDLISVDVLLQVKRVNIHSVFDSNRFYFIGEFLRIHTDLCGLLLLHKLIDIFLGLDKAHREKWEAIERTEDLDTLRNLFRK